MWFDREYHDSTIIPALLAIRVDHATAELIGQVVKVDPKGVTSIIGGLRNGLATVFAFGDDAKPFGRKELGARIRKLEKVRADLEELANEALLRIQGDAFRIIEGKSSKSFTAHSELLAAIQSLDIAISIHEAQQSELRTGRTRSPRDILLVEAALRLHDIARRAGYSHLDGFFWRAFYSCLEASGEVDFLKDAAADQALRDKVREASQANSSRKTDKK